jgi:Tc5 transposase DNA-binding domain
MPTMGYKRTSKVSDLEDRIQGAISALKNPNPPSVRGAASEFKVSHQTLRRRITGGLSRAQATEMTQLLSNAEEKTLVRWITRYICAGSPMTPALLKELAESIRHRRVRHASQNNPTTQITTLIGNEWLYRFLNRHPTIQGIYAR